MKAHEINILEANLSVLGFIRKKYPRGEVEGWVYTPKALEGIPPSILSPTPLRISVRILGFEELDDTFACQVRFASFPSQENFTSSSKLYLDLESVVNAIPPLITEANANAVKALDALKADMTSGEGKSILNEGES